MGSSSRCCSVRQGGFSFASLFSAFIAQGSTFDFLSGPASQSQQGQCNGSTFSGGGGSVLSGAGGVSGLNQLSCPRTSIPTTQGLGITTCSSTTNQSSNGTTTSSSALLILLPVGSAAVASSSASTPPPS
ncbi:MAG: hypothetical protein ACYDD6_04605 [Acidimicrobiales bacterium]